MLDNTIKDKLIEALTSGKYSQTTGTLKDGQGYCCLGVLCDITKDITHAKWDNVSYSNGAVDIVDSKKITSAALPTATISKQLGIAQAGYINIESIKEQIDFNPLEMQSIINIDGHIVGVGLAEGDIHYVTLASLNDAGVPFKVIADFIKDKEIF